MKLSKIIKKLEKKFKINFWISLLPMTLLVGILSQLFILSYYNSVVFFSWGQVLNDTVILSLLVIALILGYMSYDLFLKVKPNIFEKWRGFLFILYILIILSFLLGLISYFINTFNIYLLGSSIFYFFGYIYAIVGAFGESKGNKKIDEKYWIFMVPSLYLFIYVIFFILFLCLSIIFNNYIFQNIEIKIDKNYKINYMNDKYIFYLDGSKTKIIPNNGKFEFIINNPLKITKN